MKKYTVIYGYFYSIGSQRNSISKFIHIECDPSKIKEALADVDIDITAVWFIFEGHCELTKD